MSRARDNNDLTAAGVISIDSPMARALLGKVEDDLVKVELPEGIRNFEIIRITYEQDL